MTVGYACGRVWCFLNTFVKMFSYFWYVFWAFDIVRIHVSVYEDVSLYELNLFLSTEQNQCVPNPCKNGGNCYDEGDNYKCTCIRGYTGYNCEGLSPYQYMFLFSNTSSYFFMCVLIKIIRYEVFIFSCTDQIKSSSFQISDTSKWSGT